MTTKEEYEKAIENIREAFYATTCPEWALEKFATNLDFISISIKEHFEEKTETNYEHYKDEIIEDYSQNLAVVKGIPTLCYKTNCNDCDFKINQIGCRNKAKEWLKQPYKKTAIKLTKFEVDFLQINSKKDFRFKNINVLTFMKEKGYFKDVDEDATIEDILANCEVIK